MKPVAPGPKTIEKSCPVCAAVYFVYPSINQKHCSKACSIEAVRRRNFERNSRPCKVCGTQFVPKHNKSPGLYCSYECSGKAQRLDRVRRGNYWAVLVPDHPGASKQGYVLLHRLLAEKKIGRLLSPGEVVHHVNFNPTDNHLSNLAVISESEHSRIHAKETRRKVPARTFAKATP